MNNDDKVKELISNHDPYFIYEISSSAIQMVISHNSTEFDSKEDRQKEVERTIKHFSNYEELPDEKKNIVLYYIKIVQPLIKG